MELATIHVSGVNAKVVQKASVPKGIVGGYVDVIFDDDWKGLRRTAVIQGAVTLDILDVGDRFQVPQEAVAEAGVRLKIGFYGIGEDGRLGIPTLWADLGVVQDAADPSGDEATDPALPIWAQIQTQIGSLENLDTQAKDTLVEAINEALTKGGSVDPEAIRAELEKYLEEHPIEAGATEEQAAQIQKNKEDIEAILADFEAVGLTEVEVHKILIPEQTVTTHNEATPVGGEAAYIAELKLEEPIHFTLGEPVPLIVRVDGVDYEATGTGTLDGDFITLTDTSAGFMFSGIHKNWLFWSKNPNTTYTISVRYRDVVETVLKLPESILPDSVLAKPDWNAKEGEAGHVLNRTHWSEGGDKEILTETEAILQEDGEFYLPNIIEVTAGETYTVKYNGVEYNCNTQEIEENGMTCVVLGNLMIIGGADTGEPFVMLILPPEFASEFGVGAYLFPMDGATSATISIGDSETIHKLDNKYLDLDWLPTKTDVPTTLYDGDVIFTVSNTSTTTLGIGIEAGKTYTVDFDGVTYTCVGQVHRINNAELYLLGNQTIVNHIYTFDLNHDTGEPFVYELLLAGESVLTNRFFVNSTTAYANSTVPLKIVGTTEVHNKLPEEFLPESVARTTDIPTKVSQLENDSHYVTEEVAEQILDGYAKTEDIPTDEHINGLIDTKLEDLPSGGGGSSGGGKQLTLINEITLAEEVAGFDITTDKNGNPLSEEYVVIKVRALPKSTEGAGYLTVRANWRQNPYNGIIIINSASGVSGSNWKFTVDTIGIIDTISGVTCSNKNGQLRGYDGSIGGLFTEPSGDAYVTLVNSYNGSLPKVTRLFSDNILGAGSKVWVWAMR